MQLITEMSLQQFLLLQPLPLLVTNPIVSSVAWREREQLKLDHLVLQVLIQMQFVSSGTKFKKGFFKVPLSYKAKMPNKIDYIKSTESKASLNFSDCTDISLVQVAKPRSTD